MPSEIVSFWLATVIWLATPDFAEWCVLDRFDDDRILNRVGVAHRDPAKHRIAAAGRLFPHDIAALSGVGLPGRLNGHRASRTAIPGQRCLRYQNAGLVGDSGWYSA